MSTLTTTILLAFILLLIALLLLGIGWLFTGKSKIRTGACGRDPHKLREEEKCGTSSFSCQLCQHSKSDKTKETDEPI